MNWYRCGLICYSFESRMYLTFFVTEADFISGRLSLINYETHQIFPGM